MSTEPFKLDPSDPAYPGQAIYSRRSLLAYDAVVVRLSNSLVWRCPAQVLQEQYDRHVGASHLDVGPGTGYYLDHGRFRATPRIALLDPNPDVLRFAESRLRRYAPATHAADVLRPIDLPAESFDSIGISYVLHCLPGNLDAKARAFDNLLPLVRSGGVIFGSTILNGGVRHSRIGQQLMRVYNRRGIFANLGDDLDTLRRVLEQRFTRTERKVVGSVALFAGWAE